MTKSRFFSVFVSALFIFSSLFISCDEPTGSVNHFPSDYPYYPINPNDPNYPENPNGGDYTNYQVTLTIDTEVLTKYGRVTLNWTSPDTTSTYVICRTTSGREANIATCGPDACWFFDPPYKYHYTDELAEQTKTYSYQIKSRDGIPLSNIETITVPVIKEIEPDDSVKLVEGLVCDSSFWGTWVNMATGVEYTVYENYVTSSENSKYAIASSSSSGKLIVEGLENFTVESGSQGAILVDNKGVPYFRKGGVNLDYQLKIVGFAKSRAISSFKVTSKSNKYKSYTSEDTVSDGETVNLTAPVQGDTQTVTVELSDGGLVVVPDITINNTGDKMGTIAVNEDNKYTLKVSGLVSEEDRTQGYLYKGNKYPLTLKLVNTSDLDIYSSSLKVYSTDSALNVSSAEGKDLSGILVSKMYPESEFETQLYVEYAGNISGYVDSGLTVEIKNGNTGDVWEDYIPLRFFEGLVPLSFSCESVSDNDSALNGFVIYPDGNSKFFAVRGGGKKTLYVPKFKNGDEYILAFSGATTARYLSDSTEVFYGVNLGSATAKVLATSGEIIEDYIKFGGENHSMVNRCELSQDNLTSGFFEAHLSSGEADYYGFKLDSYSSVSAEKAEFDTNYHITYENPKANTVILTWTLESGKEISYFDIYRNGMKISERSINSSEEKWTDVNCKPGTHYVYTFVNPQDNLVSVSNTLGLTTSYLKYTSSDIDGHYDDEEGGIIFYFKQFTDIPSYLSESSKYSLLTDEFTDIIVYRNGQKLFNLSDFEKLFYDQQSIACYQEYGFYMIFSGDGNVSMNYTPKDNCFGFIDMSAQQGVPYTYYFRDIEGHKISVDQKMKG